jgi:hypothetical protein
VSKNVLTDFQIRAILNYKGFAEWWSSLSPSGYESPYGSNDEWEINETENEIRGETFMDNFQMIAFMKNVLEIDGDDINEN